MVFEIIMIVWLGGLTAALWFHIRMDGAALDALIERMERQDRRVMDVMSRIDKTLMKLIPS